MNPYTQPGAPRPQNGAAPGFYSGPPSMPAPHQLQPPGVLGPPTGGPPAFTPSSFPATGPPQVAPSSLPPPRPQPRPAGPPPILQPPSKSPQPSAAIQVPSTGAAPAAAAPPTAAQAAPRPALRPTEPLKKLMASVTFIAPTVENEFLEKLFSVFGAVKSMKRPQDPSTKKLKTFAFVEYETPDSLRVALRVLPNQTIDGQDIQVKPTNPTKQYLDWWELNGKQAAGSSGGTEDGEAVDEDAAEMEATEAVIDLVSRRTQPNGSSRERDRDDGRSDRGHRGSDTDAIIRAAALDQHRADDRQARLEREFETDHIRRMRQSEHERRRERKEVEELMRQVRQAEEDASRARQRRTQRLSDLRERRTSALKQDNDANRREDDDDADKWRVTSRTERQREAEADEADRMAELEEEAQRRGAAAAAAAAAYADAPPSSAAAPAHGMPAPKSIVDMNDSIMKAMLQQVHAPDGKGGNAADIVDANAAQTGGGWSSMGGAAPTESVGGNIRLAAPSVDADKAAATKKAFFGDRSDENKPRPGAWLLEQRAKAAADPACNTKNGDSDSASRKIAFESERHELMQRIPTTLGDAANWPLRREALNLDSPSHLQHLQKRIAKYVHEVLPSDEEAIANEVLTRVSNGDSAHALCEFCEFLGTDATNFTLKVWRLLIAESELSQLRVKYGISS